MYMAAFSYPADRVNGPLLGRRAIVWLLVIALHALLLWMMISLAPPQSGPHGQAFGTLKAFFLADDEAERARAAAPPKSERHVVSPKAPSAAERPPSTPMDVSAATIWSRVLHLDSAQYAAADIAHMRAAPADAQASAEQGEAEKSKGGGPHGETLYDADWYRKPTDAELATYIPQGGARTGWGMVACRTVERYRVEDCVEIGQSPEGSGFARAVRQAAWQFRVMPPRINGRPMVGAWVRIRIDYTERRAG